MDFAAIQRTAYSHWKARRGRQAAGSSSPLAALVGPSAARRLRQVVGEGVAPGVRPRRRTGAPRLGERDDVVDLDRLGLVGVLEVVEGQGPTGVRVDPGAGEDVVIACVLPATVTVLGHGVTQEYVVALVAPVAVESAQAEPKASRSYAGPAGERGPTSRASSCAPASDGVPDRLGSIVGPMVGSTLESSGGVEQPASSRTPAIRPARISTS